MLFSRGRLLDVAKIIERWNIINSNSLLFLAALWCKLPKHNLFQREYSNNNFRTIANSTTTAVSLQITPHLLLTTENKKQTIFFAFNLIEAFYFILFLLSSILKHVVLGIRPLPLSCWFFPNPVLLNSALLFPDEWKYSDCWRGFDFSRGHPYSCYEFMTWYELRLCWFSNDYPAWCCRHEIGNAQWLGYHSS